MPQWLAWSDRSYAWLPERRRANQNKLKDGESPISILANKEVEGHIADGAMLTRRTLRATGSWTSTGNGRTCAPILSDWLDKAGENAVHAKNKVIQG